MKIGFIGLGNMGHPMAANLLRAGFDLVIHDIQPRSGQELLERGATWADHPQSMAETCQAVITSLPGPPQVEAVYRWDRGLLAGAQSGTTWIDMSTSSPELTKQIASLAARESVSFLDAPVTGAVDGAQAGSLTIFVGGDTAVFEKHLPLFEVMGERIFHCGPLGTGLAAKLLTNLLWFVNAVAIGEGLMLGRQAGIKLPLLWEIIKASAGNSWVAEHDIPSIFRGDYDPSFTLNLCSKDLHLIHNLGRDLGVPLELGSHVEQIFSRARAHYGGDAGEMHVVRALEDLVGSSLQIPDFAPASDENLPSAGERGA